MTSADQLVPLFEMCPNLSAPFSEMVQIEAAAAAPGAAPSQSLWERVIDWKRPNMWRKSGKKQDVSCLGTQVQMADSKEQLQLLQRRVAYLARRNNVVGRRTEKLRNEASMVGCSWHCQPWFQAPCRPK